MSTARSIAAVAFVLGYKPGGYPRQRADMHLAAPPLVVFYVALPWRRG